MIFLQIWIYGTYFDSNCITSNAGAPVQSEISLSFTHFHNCKDSDQAPPFR